MKRFLKKPIRIILGQFPKLAYTVLTISDAIDRFERPITTPWGFSLAGHKAMAKGTFEPEETNMMRNLTHEIDIFINVGANVGYYCCHALSLGKPVIAVEPNVRNLWYLMKNMKNNGWAQKVEIFPLAVGEGPDILEIYGWETGASIVKGWQKMPESFASLTPTLSLDRILSKKLEGKRSLIMVDIEGAEFMMLKGASETLSNHPPPIWMIEIHLVEHQPRGVKTNPHFRETFEIFFEHGYTCTTIEKKPLEITPLDISSIEQGKVKLNTHNFLFKKN